MQGEFTLLPGRYDAPCRVYRRPRLSVAALGVASLLSYSAYRGLSALQSSINPSGLGTSSLAGAALFFTGTLMLLTSAREVVNTLLGRVGYRSTMVASTAACSSYVLAQTLLQLPQDGGGGLYVSAILLTSAVVGVGGALNVYCILRYLEVILRAQPDIKVTTMGWFLACWKLATVCGNMVSSVVLSTDASNSPQFISENITVTCGLNFWPGDKYIADNENLNLNRPTDTIINWICGVYFGFMVLSVIILILCVEDPERSDAQDDVETVKTSDRQKCDILKETCNEVHESQPDTLVYTLLLTPMFLSLGLGHAFLEADFTSAFVTCIFGLKYVGWMMVYDSLFEGLGITIGLHLVTGECSRVFVTVMAVLVQLGFVFHLVIPTMQVTAMFAGVAAFGLGSGLVLATTTLVKPLRLAPSMLFQLLGLIVGYWYSVHLFTEVKSYILVSSLLVGCVAYLAAETYRTFHKQKLTARVVH